MMKNVVEGWNRIVVSGSDAGVTEMDLAKFYVTINDIHAMLMALTDEEKKGLLGIQQTEMKSEEDF